MKISLAASVLALAMTGAGTASATEVLGMGTPSAEQFRAKATSSDAFEITSSKIAQTHATDAQIKDFAAMMIRDHTASTDKLVALGGIYANLAALQFHNVQVEHSVSGTTMP